MKVCPRCQHENPDDADFCAKCKNYLRWDPTRAVPAVPPPAAVSPPSPGHPPAGPPPTPPPAASPPPPPPPQAPAAPPVARSDEVQLTLGGPDGTASGRPTVSMPPGGQGELQGAVRNQSGKVDNYDLRLEGIPAEWYTITPSTVYLVPFGARAGDFEHDLRVQFHPPRSAEATAGARPVTLVARSRASGADVGAVDAELTITPFHQLESELRPERGSGRRKASFAVATRNSGNAPIEIGYDGEDEEQLCKFTFADRKVTANPGRRAGTEFTVEPRSQIWVGRPVERPFTVAATSADGAQAEPVRGVFKQKPWLPWWSPIVLALLIVAAVFLWNQYSNKSVSVPSLRGDTLAQADAKLKDAGLQLSTDLPQTKTLPGDSKDWGKIISQTPEGKSSAKKNAVVSVVLGAGPPTAKVPNLCGQTLAQATALAKQAGLALVPPDPTPAATDHSLASNCQAPAAGQLVAQGAPVKVTFNVSAAAAAANGGGSPNAAVPATPAAAAAAGFTVQKVPLLDPAVAFGQTISQTPAAGQMVPKGSPITIYVSQPPPVTYDDLTSIFVQQPGAKAAKLISTTGATDTEPSYSPDATQLAYLQRASGGAGAVHVINQAATPAVDQPLSAAGVDAHRPVFAPDPTKHVVAYTVWPPTGSTGSTLCFADLDAPAAVPCTSPDATYDLDRPTWAPDGLSIMAVALDPTTEQPAGMVQFTTQTPFDANGSDWVETPGLVVTGPVQYAAFSPKGRELALSVGATAPVLQIAQIQNGALQTPKQVGATPIPAGALAWWADKRLAYSAAQCQATSPITVLDPNAPTPTPVAIPGQVGCNPSYLPQQVATP